MTVASDQALTIDPGVEVRFTDISDDQAGGEDNNRAELYVYSTILEEGTEADSIVFTSNSQSPSSGDWYGIYLRGNSAHGTFSYNRIEYATYGIRMYHLFGSTSDTIRITHSLIQHSGTGIYDENGHRSFIIADNVLQYLSGYGIQFEYAGWQSVARIQDNIVQQTNSPGMYFNYRDSVIVSGNTIDGGGSEGIYLYQVNAAVISENSVLNKSNEGISDYIMWQTLQ